MTAVVPYVPTEELHLLPRDVLANEPRRALNGGARGTRRLEQAADAAARWLRPGGSVLLEVGGDRASDVATTLAEVGPRRYVCSGTTRGRTRDRSAPRGL